MFVFLRRVGPHILGFELYCWELPERGGAGTLERYAAV